MTIPRGRQEPDYPTNIPGMIWGQGPELNAAMIAEIDRETRGVDMMFYRLTVPEIVGRTDSKAGRGRPGASDRRANPVSQRQVAGVLVGRGHGGSADCRRYPGEAALHQGLTHIKGMITSNVALNASSNFARGWERDHNYFITASGKPLLYSAYRQRFDAMWNDTVNYGPFQQQPPYPPTQVSPANGVVNVADAAETRMETCALRDIVRCLPRHLAGHDDSDAGQRAGGREST